MGVSKPPTELNLKRLEERRRERKGARIAEYAGCDGRRRIAFQGSKAKVAPTVFENGANSDPFSMCLPSDFVFEKPYDRSQDNA